VTRLEQLDAEVEDALERVRVPAYVIDKHGIVRWVNKAAEAIVGDVRGKQLTSVVAPEEKRRAQEIFYRNLTGGPTGSDNKGVVMSVSGERVGVELSSVPLKQGGHVIGVFGQVLHVDKTEVPAPPPHLTPRQTEVLELLAHGRSTNQIADELHLSTETVRNHIRGVLRALGAHSRLEAVFLAHNEHLVAA
jgi:PAS domain S-box-containing protein